MERYRIDDPVEAVQIHGICGFFGVLNVGIFGNEYGLITTSENSFKQFGIQIMGALAIGLWGFICSYIYFKTVSNLGRLRVNKFYEIVGIDIVMHTMSDQIGDNDDFDRDSRTQQYQNDIMRSRIKKRIEEESKLNDGNYEDTVSEASFND